MKVAPYVEKLNNSGEFKDFSKKYKGAFMVAGFFVIDFENGKNIHQLDYYLPSEKKIAAFTLDHKVVLQIMNMMNSKVPQKLDMKNKTDLDALKGILEDEMKNRNITQEIRKMIAIIQNLDGKKIWNINCVLSGMDILRAHVEDESQSVLKMEKNSIMDYIQKVPAAQIMQKMKGAQAGIQQPGQPAVQVQQGAQQAGAEEQPSMSPEEAQKKLKQIQELEQEIEKEKAELSKPAVKAKVSKASAVKKSAPVKAKAKK